jgi:hypothetical protein
MRSMDRKNDDTKMRKIKENTIKQVMRSCGTKRKKGKENVNSPLHSTDTENNINKEHEKIQETKGVKIN